PKKDTVTRLSLRRDVDSSLSLSRSSSLLAGVATQFILFLQVSQDSNNHHVTLTFLPPFQLVNLTQLPLCYEFPFDLQSYNLERKKQSQKRKQPRFLLDVNGNEGGEEQS